ncbi:MAG: TolC family protein [Chlamydiae bacterium]|nr:TolC family protein [Chlamydiota bacterium]MBI3265526.1 TolC family protein [Chlamydiota bacterium]
MKFIFVVFLSSLYFSCAFAEERERLSLPALIEEVLQKNPDLKMAEKKWEAAHAQILQAGVLEDPMLGVEVEGIPTDTVDVGRYNDIEWSFSQNFPFPGKLSLKKKIAWEEAEKAHLEYFEKKNQIVADVKMAYVDYDLMFRTIQILEDDERILSQFEESARSKYEVGKVSQQDVLKAQVEWTKIKNQILIKNQEKETLAARINMLLSQSPGELLGDPEPLSEETSELDLDSLLSSALEGRPELKMKEAEIKGMEWALRLARRQYEPDFFTKLESRQFQGAGLEEYDVMLGMSIPWLWTRSRVEGAVQEARANLEAARNEYEAKKWAILFEVKESWVKVHTSVSLVNLYRSNILPKADQMIKVSQINYETDKIDFLMLLDSLRTLVAFQLEYREAIADYHKNSAQLERRVGKQNTEFRIQNK